MWMFQFFSLNVVGDQNAVTVQCLSRLKIRGSSWNVIDEVTASRMKALTHCDCLQNLLIEKLQEQLSEFDKKAKSNVRLIQRKERLAFVTVNLTNVIQVVFHLSATALLYMLLALL